MIILMNQWTRRTVVVLILLMTASSCNSQTMDSIPRSEDTYGHSTINVLPDSIITFLPPAYHLDDNREQFSFFRIYSIQRTTDIEQKANLLVRNGSTIYKGVQKKLFPSNIRKQLQSQPSARLHARAPPGEI
jgi:hypothetical protein